MPGNEEICKSLDEIRASVNNDNNNVFASDSSGVDNDSKSSSSAIGECDVVDMSAPSTVKAEGQLAKIKSQLEIAESRIRELESSLRVAITRQNNKHLQLLDTIKLNHQ